MPSGYTAQQLADLKTALAAGELTVRHADGRMVTYRSVAELEKAIGIVAEGLARDAGTTPVRQYRVRTTKGL